MSTELEDVKREVATANRVLANLGLATGLTAALGHASMRVPSQPHHFFGDVQYRRFFSCRSRRPDPVLRSKNTRVHLQTTTGRQCGCACPPTLYHLDECSYRNAQTDAPRRRTTTASAAADLSSRENDSE